MRLMYTVNCSCNSNGQVGVEIKTQYKQTSSLGIRKFLGGHKTPAPCRGNTNWHFGLRQGWDKHKSVEFPEFPGSFQSWHK